jgi:hypothetical protein
MALTVNMNLASGEEPFLADDFLGTGNREKRQRDRREGAHKAAVLNRKISEIKPLRPGEEEPEWLPDWARKFPRKERDA